MTETTRLEWHESLGRVRSLLDGRRSRASGAEVDGALLGIAGECVRLLNEGARELAETRNEQRALASELANLRDRCGALERSVLFRALHALGLDRPLR